jgi:peptidoglycan/LPS O-acetylase OafA/YrhL
VNRQFGALRGLAIIIVVLYHSISMGLLAPEDWGYPPVESLTRDILLTVRELGLFAVPTFLFISGSFVAYAARGNPPRLSWQFVRVGLGRMLWPYLLWSIAFYVMIYFRRDEVYTGPGYLKNLLVGYPYHFVPLLFMFYAVSPLLVSFAKRYGYVLIFVVAFYQLFLLVVLYPGILGLDAPRWARFMVPPVVSSTLALWGVYFPLGLVYSLHAKRVTPWLRKFKWGLLAATAVLFALAVLDQLGLLRFRVAAHICPLTFILLTPLVKRNSIPMVRRFEEIGKRSYGLYLIHLIPLELVFLGLATLTPWMLDHQIILQPVLFFLTLVIPLLLMGGVVRLPSRTMHRYVFG